MAVAEGQCEVLWQSDKQRTLIMYDQLHSWKGPHSAGGESTVPPVDTPSESKSIKFRRLIPSTIPSGLVCPLHSTDVREIKKFQLRFDNYLFSGHPNVEKVVLGQIDNPLQYCEEFMEMMRLKYAPEEFQFDPRKTKEYLDIVAVAKPDLLAKLEHILDNGKSMDGYRQVNKAIYTAAVECIKADDLVWISTSVARGDGVG